MTDKTDEAIAKVYEARRLGIYSADFKIVKLTSTDTCTDDLSRENALDEANRRQCNRSINFLSGSQADTPKRVAFIKPLADDLTIGLYAKSLTDHPNFRYQTVFHEAAHFEFAQIHTNFLEDWLEKARRVNPKVETALTQGQLGFSMTENFSDAMCIMAQVKLGLLDKSEFSNFISILRESRDSKQSSPSLGWFLKDAKHDSKTTLNIVEKIGFDAIMSTPNDQISKLAIVVTVAGQLQKYRIPDPLPELPVEDGIAKTLAAAGAPLPKGTPPAPSCKAPTLADLMALSPHQAAAITRPVVNQALEHGLILDWSVVGPNAPKPWQPGLNPAWKRQRDAAEIATPDPEPRKLPVTP